MSVSCSATVTSAADLLCQLVRHTIETWALVCGEATIRNERAPHTRYEKRLPNARERTPDNPLTWSAAGELQPGRPCWPPENAGPTTLKGGSILPQRGSEF